MPSTSCSASLPARPCARSPTCSVMRDPPMSGVLWRTPADSTPIDITLRDTGSVSIASREIVCVREACCTSTCGAWPETVTVSSSAPTFISVFTVAMKSAGKSMRSRTTVLNPASVKVTEYTPGRSASSRYRPWPSLTVVLDCSISAGLAAVTVTPGSAAPDSSLTWPTMAAWASASVGTNRSHAAAPIPARIVFRIHPSRRTTESHSAPSTARTAPGSRTARCRHERRPAGARFD